MCSEMYQDVCLRIVHEKIPHVCDCDFFLQANMSICNARVQLTITIQLTMPVTHRPNMSWEIFATAS